MAENRTFKFYGLGYGVDPVTITATLGGQPIFSGEIPTVNEQIDPFPYPTPSAIGTTVMFTLDNFADLNTDFAGKVPMAITVTGGRGAILSRVECNWVRSPTFEVGGITPASVDSFHHCYDGIPVNAAGSSDCRSEVVLDGVAQDTQIINGVWDWRVMNTSTITYNLNVAIGAVGDTPGFTGNYVGPYTPVPNFPSSEASF